VSPVNKHTSILRDLFLTVESTQKSLLTSDNNKPSSSLQSASSKRKRRDWLEDTNLFLVSPKETQSFGAHSKHVSLINLHNTTTTMLCAISGESPQAPVASRKSGNVFERRLIEAHIAEHHTDPVNGEDLTLEDLIELKSPRIVTPRPPNLTSIPSLLSAFQSEWDSLLLESFTLKQQLSQTRQELSTALYQNDAATRVVARLTRERDDAREALSNVTVSGGGAVGNGDAMQVDGQALPQELVDKVDVTQAEYVFSQLFEINTNTS
jgi:hypothetical protein